MKIIRILAALLLTATAAIGPAPQAYAAATACANNPHTFTEDTSLEWQKGGWYYYHAAPSRAFYFCSPIDVSKTIYAGSATSAAWFSLQDGYAWPNVSISYSTTPKSIDQGLNVDSFTIYTSKQVLGSTVAD